MAMEDRSLDELVISQDPQANKPIEGLKAKNDEKAWQERKARNIALELENIAKLSGLEIWQQFRDSNRFKNFSFKALAVAFLLRLPADSGAQIFARDIVPNDKSKNDDCQKKKGGAKTFYVSIPKAIYRRSDLALTNGEPEKLYEWAGDNMKIGDTTVKTGVDLDMEGVTVTRAFNDDIRWVAEFINDAIVHRYKVEVPLDHWVVLKCDYDPVKQKHSAHLILDGFMWPTIEARKMFLKSIGLVEEFAKRCPEANNPLKVVDDGVFGVKFLRLLKSSKAQKKLPLWGASLPGMMVPTNDLSYFQKSMTTYTVGCQLLEDPAEYRPAVPMEPARSSHRQARNVDAAVLPPFPPPNEIDNIQRYAPPFEVLKGLVTSLDQDKRFAKGSHDAWIELGFAITNVGRTGGYEVQAKKLFHELSAAFPLLYKESEVSNLLDGSRTHSKRKGWTYLKSCLLEDNKSRHEEMFGSNGADKDLASPGQVSIAKRSQQNNNVTIIGPDIRFDTSTGLNELANFGANFNEMKSELEMALGFRNVSLLQAREAGFNFDADRDCKCPLCAVATHGTNAYYCLEVMPRVFVIRNYASGCKQHTLGWEEQRHLQNLLLTPDSDAPYVDLFEAHFKRRLKWTGKGFLFFKDHLWRPIPTEEVYNTISSMANVMLERLLQSLAQRQIELDVQNGDKDVKKLNKEQYNGVLKGMKYIKRNSNVRGMVEMTKNRLISDVDKCLDVDPYLLGTENGILDLKTGQLRAGVPEDNISKSVGYAFFDDLNPHNASDEDAFNSFITRIYPVDEEREVVQRFCGYTLLGSHPEKKMCLFTDARGGYNGKSSMCKALMAALGNQYAHKPKAELLYKPDLSSGTIDSHSSGMLHFRGVRLAIVEELDEKKTLNNALIKDLNGGNSTFEGRGCKSPETVSFPWITKMVLAFNNQRMPNFDFTDPALLNRFLIIQHRSRFCTEDDDYDRNADVPFTFRAVPDLDELLALWKPYILKWCLSGLQNYFRVGFRRFPPSCEEWKKAFVAQRDLVAAFVGDYMEKTDDPNVCLVRAEIYTSYYRYTPEEQKPKTSLGKGRFFEALKKVLGEQDLRARHNNHRDCFTGWRFKT